MCFLYLSCLKLFFFAKSDEPTKKQHFLFDLPWEGQNVTQARGGEIIGEFWISKASTGVSILQTILSIFPIYVLFRSSKKTTRLKLLFRVKRRSLGKGDRPAGRLLKIASTAERRRGGWCCTVSCALPCPVLSNRDKRGKVECIDVMH